MAKRHLARRGSITDGATVKSTGITLNDDVPLLFGTDEDWTAQYISASSVLGITGPTDGSLTLREGSSTRFVFDLNNSRFDIRDGYSLRVHDAADTDYIDQAHNGTDYNLTTVNTRHYALLGLTGQVRIQDGAGLRVYDSTDSDYVTQSHDGTDYNLIGTNTTDLNIVSMGLNVQDEFALEGEILDSITANQDDYSPTGIDSATVVHIDADGDYVISSIDASQRQGRILIIQVNDNANTVTLEHGSASGTAANRIVCPNAVDYVIPLRGSVMLQYQTESTVADRWYVIGTVA